MPFNHCPDRLTDRSEEVNKVLSPLKLKNKGMLMTLQSSQKYLHSMVTLTAELGRHLLRNHKHRAKLLAAATTLLQSLLPHGRENECTLHCKNWRVWCLSSCLPALVPLPQLSVTAEAALPSIPLCRATPSTS